MQEDLSTTFDCMDGPEPVLRLADYANPMEREVSAFAVADMPAKERGKR